jgi:hypothetical protein
MPTDRDVTRMVQTWLRKDEHESADRVLDNVLALLDTTPQRGPMWPARRNADPNTVARWAIVAAAVLVVAVIGIYLLPTGGVGPAVTASPSPSPTPTPTPTVPPSPSAATLVPPRGLVEIGRHSFSQSGIAFSLDFTTSGWSSSGVAVAPDGVNITKGLPPDKNAAWLLSWSIDGVYADPCGHVPSPTLSPSAADLASAVATLPGAELVSGPTDVTLDGRVATFVSISIPEDVACPPRSFLLWWDDADCDAEGPCERWVTGLGETQYVWIFEIDGQHVWIEAETYKDASPALVQEVQQIVESIRFE